MADSLQTLASRAWIRAMMKQEKAIPELTEAAVADRRAALLESRDKLDRERAELQRRIKALEEEERADVRRQKKELEEQVRQAVDLYQPLDPDRYCPNCKRINYDRLMNQCSVEGCEFHKICPRCDSPFDFPPDCTDHYYRRIDGFDNDNSEDILCWEQSLCRKRIDHIDSESESEGGLEKLFGKLFGNTSKELGTTGNEQGLGEEFQWHPCETGYLRCWICQDQLCAEHFVEHYKPCRVQASQRCGFLPPTSTNNGHCALRAPGHCGRNVEMTPNRGYMNSKTCMQPGCSTTCCSDCVTVCWEGGLKRKSQACEFKRCKLHNECDGECKHW